LVILERNVTSDCTSVIVPLIATVGVNNKVTFLEKHGTGYVHLLSVFGTFSLKVSFRFPNSTGAYELDLSLANDFSKAWRELDGVKTDVFCAGSVILPDKAGRQINVGGWSGDSTFGLRLFTPNGVPGTNSTSDWEEDFPALSLQVCNPTRCIDRSLTNWLQRGRWYPTAAVLSNGSVLVIGGETGSNAAPQPNLEILPKPDGGDTVIDLPWLQRTDPNNLYPFVFILPSQNIFVGRSQSFKTGYMILIQVLQDTGTRRVFWSLSTSTRSKSYPTYLETSTISSPVVPILWRELLFLYLNMLPIPIPWKFSFVVVLPTVLQRLTTIVSLSNLRQTSLHGFLNVWSVDLIDSPRGITDGLDVAFQACPRVHGPTSRWHIYDPEWCSSRCRWIWFGQ
jgi:hypothetical protein